MADASCSSGTPFKHLIDHQTRDTSHHQDRLAHRAAGQSLGVSKGQTKPLNSISLTGMGTDAVM